MIGKTNALVGGGGPSPSGTIQISSNGIYDVGSYASANVNVTSPSTEPTLEDYLNNMPLSYISTSATQIRNYAFSEYPIQHIDILQASIISNSAFLSCSSISTINAPSLTSIGTSVFYNCYNLSVFNAPSLSRAGNYAFWGCMQLDISQIPLNNFYTINQGAFMHCSNSSGILSTNAASIYIDAFYNVNVSQAYLGMSYMYHGLYFKSDTLIEIYSAKNMWGNAGYFGSTNIVYSYTSIYLPSYMYNAGNALVLGFLSTSHIYLGNGTQISGFSNKYIVQGTSASIQNMYINSIQVPKIYAQDSILLSSIVSNVYVPEQCITMYKNATNWALRSSYIYSYSTSNKLKIVADDIASGSSCTVTIDCNVGDHLVLCAAVRNTYSITSGWTLLKETAVYYTSGSIQQRGLVFTKTATSNQETVTLTHSISGRIYMMLINIGDKNASIRDSMCFINSTSSSVTCNIIKDTDNPVILYNSRGLAQTAEDGPTNYYNAYAYQGQSGNYDEYVACGTQYRNYIVYSEKPQGDTMLKTEIKNTTVLTNLYTTAATEYAVIAIELTN